MTGVRDCIGKRLEAIRTLMDANAADSTLLDQKKDELLTDLFYTLRNIIHPPLFACGCCVVTCVFVYVLLSVHPCMVLVEV